MHVITMWLNLHTIMFYFLFIGVVSQPVKGVAEEGAVGLVKGIGKGLIGVVTRPLGGGVDLLTATFGSLQKAVSGDKVLVKKRHPRFIGQDKVISVSLVVTVYGDANV